ncbi:hypothetical protein H9638_06120 [Arthrobacter sp. Sa2BUA2]|uniref:DUF4352 domain-containing protein n=1 Tax=Arthrobacter pullicola TaxID=2762224 RepID=A0ABR8YGQ7_9MICC|nr:DUF308 domain-containing protein [Arthrobacter pullicola]MBD8043387.1 hypothetical protein [Arthrobacter pullicola]
MDKEQGGPGLGDDQGQTGALEPGEARESGGAAPAPAPAEPPAMPAPESASAEPAPAEDAPAVERNGNAAVSAGAVGGPGMDDGSRLAPPSGFAAPGGSFAPPGYGRAGYGTAPGSSEPAAPTGQQPHPYGGSGSNSNSYGNGYGNSASSHASDAAGAQNPAAAGGPYIVDGYPAATRPLTSYDRPSGNPYAGIPSAGKPPAGGPALPPYPPAGQPAGAPESVDPNAAAAGSIDQGSVDQGGVGTGTGTDDPAAGAPEYVRPHYGMPEQGPYQYAAQGQSQQQYGAPGQAPNQYAAPGQGTPGGYGSGPGYPGAGYPGAGYPGAQPARTPGKALGIAALCLAGVGLLVSWIPFINVLTFLLGIVAIGLGIPAMIKGFRARNVARMLSIIAVGVAVVSMIIAGTVSAMVVDSLRQLGIGEYPAAEAESEPSRPLPNASGTPGAQASPDEYTYENSDAFIEKMLSAPANSAGEEVKVGDYTVTLVSVDRNASAEVQERDRTAGAPDYNYVMFEFDAVYNGDGEGRLWLDLAPEFIGADNRSYSVLDCSMDLGVSGFSQPNLAKGEARSHEVCFDLPEEALGEDSRMSLRMILAEDNDPVYWRLP